jgi:hypothetical protein
VKRNLDIAVAQLQNLGDNHADGSDSRSQNIITSILKDIVHKEFRDNLDADGKVRLKAVAQQKTPTVVISSDLQPPANKEEDTLIYTPMSRLALVCPLNSQTMLSTQFYPFSWESLFHMPDI